MRRWFFVLALTFAGSAAAHDARPVSVTLVEQSEGLYRAILRGPPTLEDGNRPQLEWPADCTVIESSPLGTDIGSRSLLRCPGGLEGQVIRIRYPLYNPSLTTLFRLQPLTGASITAVLPPDRLAWTVPAAPTFATVARDYLVLGFEHIWTGVDHLLFIFGLLLLARRPRRIFYAVTGFTVAHSITLSLAALGLVQLPVGPVEAMIALSILFLAGEIARNDPSSFSTRFPIALSFVFGLLHGFGFASALGEIGLPRGELATGLLFFNLGVETGQLSFIALIAALAAGWHFAWRRRVTIERLLLSDRAVRIASYGMGIPAAYWFFTRAALALAG
jgi:hydrogenase/urease accessory protein HupE